MSRIEATMKLFRALGGGVLMFTVFSVGTTSAQNQQSTPAHQQLR
jgi:hypothetical protein